MIPRNTSSGCRGSCVKNSLIDAGPLIALFNRDDRYHQRMVAFLQTWRGLLYTTWPVITEVTHMLDFDTRVQIDFLGWIAAGAVTMAALDAIDLERIIELARKYADLPMDLADGSLLAIAEKLHIRNIITIDSDYHVYRTKDRKALHNIFQY